MRSFDEHLITQRLAERPEETREIEILLDEVRLETLPSRRLSTEIREELLIGKHGICPWCAPPRRLGSKTRPALQPRAPRGESVPWPIRGGSCLCADWRALRGNPNASPLRRSHADRPRMRARDVARL